MTDYQCILLEEAGEFLKSLPKRHKDKVNNFLQLLESKNGILEEPYARHLRGKIRELRIDFGRIRYRFLYSLIPHMKILVLLAFRKNTPKTPPEIIVKAENLLTIYLKNL